jgi:hypothetical protein
MSSALEINTPELIFNGTRLGFVTSRKHLGVIFCNWQEKWHDHIQNINKSASKVLGLMRVLKFKIDQSVNFKSDLYFVSQTLI